MPGGSSIPAIKHNINIIPQRLTLASRFRVQKTRVFKKSPTQWVLLGFLDKQDKIGKIRQKLSNLKP